MGKVIYYDFIGNRLKQEADEGGALLLEVMKYSDFISTEEIEKLVDEVSRRYEQYDKYIKTKEIDIE